MLGDITAHNKFCNLLHYQVQVHWPVVLNVPEHLIIMLLRDDKYDPFQLIAIDNGYDLTIQNQAQLQVS